MARQITRSRTIVAALLAALLASASAAPIASPPSQQRGDDLVGLLDVAALNNQMLMPLARANDLGALSVRAANWGLHEYWFETADTVLLPAAHILPRGLRDGILINRAEFRLYYFKNGALVLTAPIGTGEKGMETPLGKASVARKQKDPAWHPTPEALKQHPDWPTYVPPGPANPMGAFAMYLTWQYYAIHGSNDEFGVGRPWTRGCIRLYAEDIERLFGMVPIGTPVEIVDQRVKLGWHGGELFLEAHPDADQIDELTKTTEFTLKDPEDMTVSINEEAGDRATDIDWSVVKETLARRSGVPTQITSRATHLLNIFVPKVALRGRIDLLKENGYGSMTKSAPPAMDDKALRKAHLLKFPFNI